MRKIELQENFLWGGATSSAQLEGGFDKGGRGKSHLDYMDCIPEEKRKNKMGTLEVDYDRFLENKKNEDSINFPFRRGVDFYSRYKEDIALFAEMGFKVFRMSISWCRLYPTGIEKKPNKEGIEFYKNIFKELKKYKIEPLITMNHYEVPIYLTEKYNGWESPELIHLFVKLSKTLIDEYKDYVKYWLTFNEINMCGYSPFTGGGMFTERTNKSRDSLIHQAIHHQFIASALTVKYMHDTAQNCKVGCMIAFLSPYPNTCKPEDVLQCQKEEQFNLYFYDVMASGSYPRNILKFFADENIEIDYVTGYEKILDENRVDFLAFSYYMSQVISSEKDKKEEIGSFVRKLKNPYVNTSEWGWSIDPVGLRISLNKIYDRYHLPIFIVENGLGVKETLNVNNTVDDDYRIEYLRAHIKQIKEAVNDGVEVMGYTPWGCIDLCSASYADMTKRYGFIYVNADDNGIGNYNRYKKASFYWYKKVIETNGNDLE